MAVVVKHALVATLMALMCPATSSAADGDEAMFGLRWGTTVEELKAAGISLTKAKGDRNLETYRTDSLPKDLSDVESYALIFADGKLAKIIAVTKNIANDPSGSTGKERFEAIQKALTEKYGVPGRNMQVIGRKLYRNFDEFYECLAYAGCGIWATTFSSPDKDFGVELKGVRRGTGYLVITAEARPQWSDGLDRYRARKAESDKDAL